MLGSGPLQKAFEGHLGLHNVAAPPELGNRERPDAFAELLVLCVQQHDAAVVEFLDAVKQRHQPVATDAPPAPPFGEVADPGE